MSKRPNLLYKIFMSQWMLDPQTAHAASLVLGDMIGAARLKAKYGIMEYDGDDDDDSRPTDYYHYYITHRDDAAIPEGKYVSVVRLEGVMTRDDAWCQPGTRQLAEWLKKGDQDQRVLASILLVDSGGGAANSVRPLADAITGCKKPVLAYCDGYMCSAAYYAASYCGHIMANDPRSMVGCIGTMIQFADYPAKAKDEDGYMRLRIYADPSDEKNADYEAALEGNFKPIRENLLNPLAEDFRRDVQANREKVKDDQLRGRTYFAQDVQGTLVDTIGDFRAAVDKALKMTNLNITTMKGHENLQSLDTCRDLQMVDGYVSLNGEQLAEIDATLGEAATERALHETDAATITSQAETIAEQLTTINDLTTERDNLQAQANEAETLRQQVATLTTERDTVRNENAQQTKRIAELEAALDGDHDEDPLPAMHNGNPAKDDSFKELTDQEAMEYARKVVRGEI